MFKSLLEGIHPDILPLSEGLLNVFLPDALDSEMLELDCHVLTAHMQGAHAPLTAVFANLNTKMPDLNHEIISRKNEWHI